MKAEHPVTALCEALEVSPGGYYDWQARQNAPSPRQQEDQQLQGQIVQLHQASRETYGVPRIQACLRAQGRHHGGKRLRRLMRQAGICGRQKRRYRVRTTESKHNHPIAPNRLAKLGEPSGPDQTWVADITYIHTRQGFVYLAGILDVYSRRIVGWSLSDRVDTELVLAAWDMACTHRQPPAGLLFHSDRGVQYASSQYRAALAAGQAVASMSRKGNCYDNAIMEAFWSTLKWELIYRRDFVDLQDVRAAVFEYIEVFYNRQRLHSALGYVSPAHFERN